jgi:hypothetical protein
MANDLVAEAQRLADAAYDTSAKPIVEPPSLADTPVISTEAQEAELQTIITDEQSDRIAALRATVNGAAASQKEAYATITQTAQQY